MIPATTDPQNATVSAIIGTAVAMVKALAGFFSSIECPHFPFKRSVGSPFFVEAIASMAIFKQRGF